MVVTFGELFEVFVVFQCVSIEIAGSHGIGLLGRSFADTTKQHRRRHLRVALLGPLLLLLFDLRTAYHTIDTDNTQHDQQDDERNARDRRHYAYFGSFLIFSASSLAFFS